MSREYRAALENLSHLNLSKLRLQMDQNFSIKFCNWGRVAQWGYQWRADQKITLLEYACMFGLRSEFCAVWDIYRAQGQKFDDRLLTFLALNHREDYPLQRMFDSGYRASSLSLEVGAPIYAHTVPIFHAVLSGSLSKTKLLLEDCPAEALEDVLRRAVPQYGCFELVLARLEARSLSPSTLIEALAYGERAVADGLLEAGAKFGRLFLHNFLEMRLETRGALERLIERRPKLATQRDASGQLPCDRARKIFEHECCYERTQEELRLVLLLERWSSVQG